MIPIDHDKPRVAPLGLNNAPQAQTTGNKFGYPSQVVPYPPTSKDFDLVGDQKLHATKEMFDAQNAKYRQIVKDHPFTNIGNPTSIGMASYGTSLEKAYPGMPVEQMQKLLNEAQVNQNKTKKNPSEEMTTWDRFYQHMPNYRRVSEKQNVSVFDSNTKETQVGGFTDTHANGVFIRRSPGAGGASLLHHELLHGIQNKDPKEDSEGLASLKKNSPDNRGAAGSEYYARPLEVGAHMGDLKAAYYRGTGKPFTGDVSELIDWGNKQKVIPHGASGFQGVINSLKINHKNAPTSPSPESFKKYLNEVKGNVVKADDNTQQPIMFNKGGKVPGFGNTDSKLAMLTPGEVVKTKEQVKTEESSHNAPSPAPTPTEKPEQQKAPLAPPPKVPWKPEPVKQTGDTDPAKFRQPDPPKLIRDPITGMWKDAPKEEPKSKYQSFQFPKGTKLAGPLKHQPRPEPVKQFGPTPEQYEEQQRLKREREAKFPKPEPIPHWQAPPNAAPAKTPEEVVKEHRDKTQKDPKTNQSGVTGVPPQKGIGEDLMAEQTKPQLSIPGIIGGLKGVKAPGPIGMGIAAAALGADFLYRAFTAAKNVPKLPPINPVDPNPVDPNPVEPLPDPVKVTPKPNPYRPHVPRKPNPYKPVPKVPNPFKEPEPSDPNPFLPPILPDPKPVPKPDPKPKPEDPEKKPDEDTRTDDEPVKPDPKPEPDPKPVPKPDPKPKPKPKEPPPKKEDKGGSPWALPALMLPQGGVQSFPSMITGIPTHSAPSFEKTHLEINYYTELGF